MRKKPCIVFCERGWWCTVCAAIHWGLQRNKKNTSVYFVNWKWDVWCKEKKLSVFYYYYYICLYYNYNYYYYYIKDINTPAPPTTLYCFVFSNKTLFYAPVHIRISFFLLLITCFCWIILLYTYIHTCRLQQANYCDSNYLECVLLLWSMLLYIKLFRNHHQLFFYV